MWSLCKLMGAIFATICNGGRFIAIRAGTRNLCEKRIDQNLHLRIATLLSRGKKKKHKIRHCPFPPVSQNSHIKSLNSFIDTRLTRWRSSKKKRSVSTKFQNDFKSGPRRIRVAEMQKTVLEAEKDKHLFFFCLALNIWLEFQRPLLCPCFKSRSFPYESGN